MDSIGKHLPNVRREFKDFKKELSSTQVDEYVSGLIKEYGSPEYRRWYCVLVYEFGIQTIDDLRGRCRDARTPARLFARLAKEMLDTRQRQRKQKEL